MKLTREELLKAYRAGRRDFSGLDLRGIDLGCCDLPYSDLRGCDLSYSDLRDSDLRGCDLRCSNLSGCDLSGSDLRESNLSGCDLSYSDLRGCNLTSCNLRCSNLRESNLSGCDLSGSDLRESDLRGCDLSYSDLRGCNLSGSDLRGCDLSYSDLRDSDLRGCDLRCSNLEDIKVDENTLGYFMACPETGEFIGYKKCRDDRIVTLKIPEDAKRSSATTRKCRCSKAIVLDIESIDGSVNYIYAISRHDSESAYEIGQTVEVKNFCEDRWEECAPGIHFFMTREEAVQYR